MKKGNKVLLAVAVLLISTGGFAFGASVGGGSLYACLSSAGTLTKVAKATIKCPKGTTLISWNQTGPAGAAGIQGPEGIQGPQGLQGSQGVQGARGQDLKNPEVLIQVEGNSAALRTTFGGRFVEINNALWPINWGTGAYVPEVGAFEHLAQDGTGNTYEVLAYLQYNCQGSAYALVSSRNQVVTSFEEERYSSWSDAYPPLPIEKEVHKINGYFYSVTDTGIERETAKSWLTSGGVCKNTKPLSTIQNDLYAYEQVTEGQCINWEYDSWNDMDACVERAPDQITAFPLYFMKATFVGAGLPIINQTSEVLKLE